MQIVIPTQGHHIPQEYAPRSSARNSRLASSTQPGRSAPPPTPASGSNLHLTRNMSGTMRQATTSNVSQERRAKAVSTRSSPQNAQDSRTTTYARGHGGNTLPHESGTAPLSRVSHHSTTSSSTLHVTDTSCSAKTTASQFRWPSIQVVRKPRACCIKKVTSSLLRTVPMRSPRGRRCNQSLNSDRSCCFGLPLSSRNRLIHSGRQMKPPTSCIVVFTGVKCLFRDPKSHAAVTPRKRA
jgi:hypothetical protein